MAGVGRGFDVTGLAAGFICGVGGRVLCQSAPGRGRALAGLLVLLVSLVGMATFERYRGDRLDVVFVSVGQGDATVVKLPGGRIMVVDGGGPGRSRLTVEPLLRRMRVGRIDYLVITHVQSDHWGGVPELAAAFEVGELWYPGHGGGGCSVRGFDRFLSSLRERGVRVVDLGQTSLAPLQGKQGWRVGVLWPQSGVSAGQGQQGCNDNNRSVVLSVDFAGHRLLLTGDIEAEAEQSLLALARDDPLAASLRADVSKVPHHGSRSSSTPAFVAAVAPELAVVSAGAGNRYGFPHAEVRRRYHRSGARVLSTALWGAVSVGRSHRGIDVDRAQRR